MLALAIHTPEGQRTVDLVQATTSIGRAPHNTIVLRDERVTRHHADVRREGSRYVLEVDLGSSGTFLNGERVMQGDLEPGDKLLLGVTSIEVVEVPSLSDEELRMVVQLQQGDEALRQVYADWLESRGQVQCAQYVRVESAVHQGPAPAESRRLREELTQLGALVGPRFTALVTRARVEACFAPGCPGQWQQLELTPTPRLRRCQQCRQDVTFCATVHEARGLAEVQQRVAVDVTQSRRPRDLQPTVVIG